MTLRRASWTLPLLAALASAQAPSTALHRVVAARTPSVVKIFGASGLQAIEPYASGVVVSKAGHVLTLDLATLQKGQTRVVLDDGTVLSAELYPPEPELGVRMLKVDAGRDLVPATVTEKDDWEHGTLVVSLGNCFRLAEFEEQVSATFGVLVARTRTGLRYRMSDVDYDGELLITDAPNNPGQHGGGLFSLSGEWIGLNTRVVASVETDTQISAAIPSWELRGYIERCIAGDTGAVEPSPEPVAGYHGVTLLERGLRRSPPAYIERVAPNSPASRAGLRADDLIVDVGDVPIRSCAEFHRTMARCAPGQEVRIGFKRGDRVLRAALTLEEARK
jgi:serine protease Do